MPSIGIKTKTTRDGPRIKHQPVRFSMAVASAIRPGRIDGHRYDER